MEQKKPHSSNILSSFFMIKDFEKAAQPDEAIKFSINYKNNLFIEYDSPKAKKYISSKYNRDAILLSPAGTNSKTLYFCHLPSEIKSRCDFEKLILQFLPNKTFKIKAYIAEKVFSVSFDTIKDADRIATFIPQIKFESNDIDIHDEKDDENDNCHIFVGGSWFDMPIVRFSNIPIDMPQKKFMNQKYIKNAVYCQFQKNKTSNREKAFQTINVIVKSVDCANEIIERYNFGSFKNEMTYVNWFVDNEILEKLEKYKVKVYPNKNDDLDDLNETKFFEEMSQYGRVFSITLCRNKNDNNINNDDDDDDSDYDSNPADEESENDAKHDDNDDDRDKEGSVLFGNVIFIDKDDIKKVQKDYKVEYWFAGGMVYNFPFETTEDDVGEYLSTFEDKIYSIELRNKDQLKEDNKTLPYFFVTFDTVDSLEEVRQYIDENPYITKGDKVKMQPFIIPKEKNLPSTIQKYNLHRDLLLRNNTVLVENLPSECSSSGLINLFAEYGTIMFIKIDYKKNKSQITANLTFSEESEMNKAIDGINDANYNSNKLKVTQYLSPNDTLNNSGSSKKKKKKKNKNANEETTNTSINSNSKVTVTKKTNKNQINLVYNNQKKKNVNNNSDNNHSNNNFRNKKNQKEKFDDDDNDMSNNSNKNTNTHNGNNPSGNNNRNYQRGGKNTGSFRGSRNANESRGGRSGDRGSGRPYRGTRVKNTTNTRGGRKNSNFSNNDLDNVSDGDIVSDGDVFSDDAEDFSNSDESF